MSDINQDDKGVKPSCWPTLMLPVFGPVLNERCRISFSLGVALTESPSIWVRFTSGHQFDENDSGLRVEYLPHMCPEARLATAFGATVPGHTIPSIATPSPFELF